MESAVTFSFLASAMAPLRGVIAVAMITRSAETSMLLLLSVSLPQTLSLSPSRKTLDTLPLR